MDIQIKLEPNSGSTCVVCLKTDVQTFGKHEISSEISLIYEELLKDHLTLLNEIGTTEMCFECMEALNGITEFKKKCVSSIEILSTKMKTVDTFGEDFFPPLEKLKDEVFVADLSVPVDMTPIDAPRRSKRAVKEKTSRNPKIKVKVNTTTVAKQERKPKTKEPTTGYCYICCRTNRTIHKHVLIVHSRTFEDGVLRCLWCNETCADAQGVLDHLKVEHAEFEYAKKCGNCEMETKSRETFFKHVHETHYANYKNVYPCDFCDAVYIDVTTYKYHMHVHLGAVKCKHCEKAFYDDKVRAAHLEEHERKLAGISYTCHFCGYNTKCRHQLVNHLQMRHVAIRNIKCDFCDKLFKIKRTLNEHVRRVHEEKRYQCNICGQRIPDKSTLRRHMRSKHREKVEQQKKPRSETRKYACDQCDMKFYVGGTLKKHKFTHSKTRPYQCHMCSTGYYMNDYLRKHYLREHGSNYSPKEIRKMCGRKRFDDSD